AVAGIHGVPVSRPPAYKIAEPRAHGLRVLSVASLRGGGHCAFAEAGPHMLVGRARTGEIDAAGAARIAADGLAVLLRLPGADRRRRRCRIEDRGEIEPAGSTLSRRFPAHRPLPEPADRDLHATVPIHHARALLPQGWSGTGHPRKHH